MHLNLASLASVRTFAAAFSARCDRLEILVANARMTSTYSDVVSRTLRTGTTYF